MDNKLTISFKNFIVYFICLFLCSCVYDTDVIYQSPVNKDVSPPVITTINLDFETEDTIFIYAPEELNFSFSSSNQTIEAVSLVIENYSPEVVSSNSGKFSFNNYSLPEGNYAVKLDVITKTGTGSIAEKVDAEHFVSTKTWVLINQKPNTTINKVVENGFQKIFWESCRSNKLIDYVVYCDDRAIGNVKTNYFIDSTFVGDRRRYEIKARLKENKTLEWGMLHVEDEMPVLDYSASKDNVYTVNWSKSKYYNAIDTVKVFGHSYYDTRDRCLKSTADENDTTLIIDKSYFGGYVSFTFQFVPKKDRFRNDLAYAERYKLRENFVMGYPFVRSNQLFPIGKDLCMVDSDDSIMSYSISEDKFTGKYMDGYGGDKVYVSPGGKYIAGARLGNGNYFYALTNELENTQLINIPDLRLGIHSNLKSVSDNGLGIFIVDNYVIQLYDLKTSTLIRNFRNEGLNLFAHIRLSSKGDYFFTSNNALFLYQITNDQVKLVTQTNEHRFYDFVSTNNQQYVTWDGSKLYLKQLPENSIVRELSITDQYICNIDFYNNEILTYSKGHLYVKSFIDGHIIHDLETKLGWALIDEIMYLQNHVLFNKAAGVSYYF